MLFERTPVDVDECLGLLSTVHTGHVALSMNALPVIFAVAFVVDGREIEFECRPEHLAAVDGNVVCFHADDVPSGWSVTVTGMANAHRDNWVRLTSEVL